MRKKKDPRPAAEEAQVKGAGRSSGRRTGAPRTVNGSRAVPGKVPRGSLHPILGNDGFSALGRIILDRLDRGVIMVDFRGRVIDANTLARRVLDDGKAITLRSGRLAFADSALDDRLAQMIQQRRAPGPNRTSVFAARVRHPAGASYRVVVSAVAADADDREVAFVLLIYAPNEQHEISTDVLHELYSLTPAQAQVARNLFAGRSVEATARALGLSLNTVRTHLKQVFTKCEVRSQAELIHLLALGPHNM